MSFQPYCLLVFPRCSCVFYFFLPFFGNIFPFFTELDVFISLFLELYCFFVSQFAIRGGFLPFFSPVQLTTDRIDNRSFVEI